MNLKDLTYMRNFQRCKKQQLELIDDKAYVDVQEN